MDELSILQIALFLFVLILLIVSLVQLTLLWLPVRNKVRSLIKNNKHRDKSWKQLKITKFLGLKLIFAFCTVVMSGLANYFLAFTKNCNLTFCLLVASLIFMRITYRNEKKLSKKLEKIKF